MRNDAAREMERWSLNQTAYWRVGLTSPSGFIDEWLRLNRSVRSIFLIDLQDGIASIRPKPDFFSDREIAEGRCIFTERVSLYRNFLSETAQRHRIHTRLTLALDVSDLPNDNFVAPVLAFQKPRGSPNVLLPDVDFFYHRWYEDVTDPIARDDKQPRIIFVGASTGGLVTEQAIRDGSLQRLALATALTGHPRIDFRIGAAVQCAEGARELLESQPYFSGPVPWDDQLRARFLLSVDGNGATCSRVVKTLMSNSVLLKHASDAMLYYFDGLIAGEHYLPVTSVDDLDRVLATDDMGHIDRLAISEAAQAFSRRFLTRSAVAGYTAALLRRLAEIMNGPERRSFWLRKRPA